MLVLKWKDVKEECMYVDSIRVLYIWFVNVSVIDIVMRESIRQLREINDFGICRCVMYSYQVGRHFYPLATCPLIRKLQNHT